MKYISLFSGIECASVAAKPLGWEPVCFSEIEPFPSAVLAHHYPEVPNVGDMTRHDWSAYRGKVDLVIGGSPCQAFSVAGKRESLDDARGNLALSFVEACDAIDPKYIVWENVPGVLNTRDNAFGCFLAALVGHDSPLHPPGKRWGNAGMVDGPKRRVAWRVLDAQYFGVPQRRRRVYLVGCPAGGADPAEILFEREGLRGNPPAGGKAGKDIALTVTGGAPYSCIGNARVECDALIVGTVSSKWAKGTGGPAGDECQNLVIHTLTRRYDSGEDGSGRDTPPVVEQENEAVYGETGQGYWQPGVKCIRAEGENRPSRPSHVIVGVGVRRLTPVECERLQGLPDGYTNVPYRGKPAADGPRYKAVGNGMAVPCVGWIFERIEKCQSLFR